MNKGIKAALALGLCCVTAAGLFGCSKAAPEETTRPATADTTVPESTTNASTDTTTKPAETTTKKAKEDSGNAYTVNQALDALTNYYGKGYDVDGTVSEGNNYYFAVYKNKKKYASVKVNMQTGDAVETRTKDGATANFNVFV
ncbi:MAG: hypothetical protein EGR79_07580 [Ruminococcaceae bacterium]|nr:hypothetical protein [Oscillospiraceae bacterium]